MKENIGKERGKEKVGNPLLRTRLDPWLLGHSMFFYSRNERTLSVGYTPMCLLVVCWFGYISTTGRHYPRYFFSLIPWPNLSLTLVKSYLFWITPVPGRRSPSLNSTLSFLFLLRLCPSDYRHPHTLPTRLPKSGFLVFMFPRLCPRLNDTSPLSLLRSQKPRTIPYSNLYTSPWS